jgi:hypothetical protein
MHDLDVLSVSRQLIIAIALVTAGCGGEASIPPKSGLSEQEKEQIKDLNEQRAQEWGPAKKK